MLEASCYPWSDFVTFTYNEENHKRVNGELSVREAQLLLDRVRRSAAVGSFRYYLVGEYGSTTWRPHYHAILFSVRMPQSFYEAKWPHGFVYVGPTGCTKDVASYCAGYVAKGLRTARAVALQGRTPEFRLMSRKPGIGVPGAWKIYEAIGGEADGQCPTEVRIGSSKFPIARHLRDRIKGWSNRVDGLYRTESSMRRFLAHRAPGLEDRRRQAGWQAAKRLEIQTGKGTI